LIHGYAEIDFYIRRRRMKKSLLLYLPFSLIVIPVGFAQTKIPAWNFQGWGLNPPQKSDVSYILSWREQNISFLTDYTLKLVNIPMGNISKPAIIIKVKNTDYSIWSDYAETEIYKWEVYTFRDYVVLSFEMSFKVPDNYSIGGAKPGERLYFRHYLDPLSPETERLVNNWVNLQGPFVVFFIGDTFGNMNYYYGDIPQFQKDVGLVGLNEAKIALTKIQNKGTFQMACNALDREVPVMERYVFSEIHKFIK
jgi:hypothetical protein